MKKIRLAFDFSKEAKETLDKLVEETGVANAAEVVRLALKLYDEAFHTISDEGTIIKHENDFEIVGEESF